LSRRQNGDTEVTWSHPDLGFLTSAASAEHLRVPWSTIGADVIG